MATNNIQKTKTAVMKRIKGVRVVSLTTKIVIIFILFMLVSNFASNYINLIFNRSELMNLTREMLIKDLKEFYNFCNNEYEIYDFDRNKERSLQNMEQKGSSDLKNDKSIIVAIEPTGAIAFQSSKIPKVANYADKETLETMNKNLESGIKEGAFSFLFNGESYFGVYKYNDKWQLFLLRGEEMQEFSKSSNQIFFNISIIIAIIVFISAVLGIFVIRFITRYVTKITNAIMHMTQNQNLELIDLKDAENDNVTFLGVAFNSLSSTINNLMGIFRKFVNKDIVQKAYKEREIRLEGTQKELAILFSDIKSFTFITETLGTDIIKLLNIHYNRAIREIINYDGIIGSIIGDAILSVYGALDESSENKSYQAIISGYKIQDVAESLRIDMHKRRENIIRNKGALTDEEEKVYKAVLLEVGVGIDGGKVFYGNIGSYDRMTNTVIGDNVNSASRLEGLTRVYKCPLICSEYIKDDVEANVRNHGLYFLELDMVQVKGKTIGKKVYWPIMIERVDEEMKQDIQHFQSGLQLYYKGDWKAASAEFQKCSLPLASVFVERTKDNVCPSNWSGIWTMTTK